MGEKSEEEEGNESTENRGRKESQELISHRDRETAHLSVVSSSTSSENIALSEKRTNQRAVF